MTSSAVAGVGLAGERRELAGVDRRPVGGQPLAELEHPGVVEVELLAPGQRVPGISRSTLMVNGE